MLLPKNKGEVIVGRYKDYFIENSNYSVGTLLIQPDKYIKYLIECPHHRQPVYVINRIYDIKKGLIFKTKMVEIEKL